nr:uncharacterized protein LOC117367239 [Geotrypetes seraphini]
MAQQISIEHFFLVTADVVALYTNVPQLAAVTLVESYLSKLDITDRKSSMLKEMISMVINNNYFNFENSIYLQTQGVAMGATVAPTIACLYMTQFEELFVYTSLLFHQVICWKRFVDDVFFVWGGSIEDLHKFINDINLKDPNITFTYQYNQHQISFLDIMISKYNNQISTSLYKKPSDRNSLLQYGSFHPRALRNGIPVGQFLRLRRICSNDEDFNKQAMELYDKFKDRGYPGKVIRRAWKRAKNCHRPWLMLPSNRQQKEPDTVCVMPFTGSSNAIKHIILKYWPILQSHPSLSQRPKFAFSRGPNLGEKLKYKHSDTSIVQRSPHQPCGKCIVCNHVINAAHLIIPFSRGRKFYLNTDTSCDSKGVIYYIRCPCHKVYIGQTTRKIKTRIIEHMSSIRTKRITAPLVSHWLSEAHSLSDLQYTVLIHVKHFQGDLSRLLIQKEQRFIYNWRTLYPDGLNSEIEWLLV